MPGTVNLAHEPNVGELIGPRSKPGTIILFLQTNKLVSKFLSLDT